MERLELAWSRRAALGAGLGLVALGTTGLALSACSQGPDKAEADLDVPAAFRASDATAPAAWPSEEWWRGFGSPELDALIARARAQNFDIAAAIARVRQADAQVRVAGAALLPALNGTGSADWQHLGLGTGSSSARGRGGGGNASIDTRSYAFGLSASYQLDFWGRNRARRESAVASAMFSRFDQRTVALTVVTSVANTWFTALALADRLTVAQGNLADAERTLAVIRGRAGAGTATALDIANQETLVNAERATIPNFRNQLEQALNGLGILTGQPPERIAVRPGTLTALALPPVNPGLPSLLLLRRPDVAAAEALLTASGFDVTVARTAFYPNVTLTGSAGYQAAALNALITPGGFLASLAAGLTAPIFDGGTLRGQLEQARGRQAELLADYRKAVVQAFTDVDNALTAWRFTTEQERLQRIAVDSARRAATIARAQMLAGTADITTVLTSENALFNAEDTLAQVRLARFQGIAEFVQGAWRGLAPVGRGRVPRPFPRPRAGRRGAAGGPADGAEPMTGLATTGPSPDPTALPPRLRAGERRQRRAAAGHPDKPGNGGRREGGSFPPAAGVRCAQRPARGGRNESRPATSRPIARASTSSTTPGRTRTSGPAATTTPSSRLLCRSRPRPAASSLCALGRRPRRRRRP